MTGPCDAYRHHQSYYACWDCGLPYWVHSHEYIPAEGHPYARGKARHIIITRHQARDMYHRYGHTLCVQVWEPDLRPRYQIMAERRVSISKFVAAHIIKARAANTRRQLKEYLAA